VTGERGIREVLEEVERHFKVAADEGRPLKHTEFGTLFDIWKNLKQAAHYFRLAADRSSSSERKQFAVRLTTGDGVKQNWTKVEKYFRPRIWETGTKRRNLPCDW
jgi:TPR repeat protein